MVRLAPFRPVQYGRSQASPGPPQTLMPAVRRRFDGREPEIDDASTDGDWRDLPMSCPDGNHGLHFTVSSALATVDQNLIEFAKSAVEWH